SVSLFLRSRRPPSATLFPYTTLFRSRAANAAGPASAAGPCRSDLLYARDLSAQNAEVSTNWNRADLQSLMWRSVGLIRQESALARAESELASWATMFPQTLGEQEDRNLLLVARLLTHAAD